MGKVVTVMNMKGGVGKTVISAHLSGMLAQYGFGSKRRKVLMIDYDPQFNLSQMFLPSKSYFELEAQRKTSLAILQDDETTLDPYTLQVPGNHTPPSVADLATKVDTNLHIVPSTLDLMYVAIGQPSSRASVFDERFRKFTEEARGIYDVVVIDCQPSGSVLTKTALYNSDHVIIPVVASAFAARGVGLMRAFLSSKGSSKSNAIPHILFNCSRGPSSVEESDIRNDPRNAHSCLKNSLMKFKAFSDPVEGDGFVWFSRRPYSDRAFGNLEKVVKEFVERSGV